MGPVYEIEFWILTIKIMFTKSIQNGTSLVYFFVRGIIYLYYIYISLDIMQNYTWFV